MLKDLLIKVPNRYINMPKTKLAWSTETRRVADLKHWGKNARKISKQKLELLKEKIVARGFHDVIVVDTDNTILSGNQRKHCLTELHITDVTVLVPNRPLTEDERDKVAIESNLHDGTWDFSKLKAFSIDLVSNIGFNDMDLSKIWPDEKVKDDQFDEDAEIKKIKQPKIQRGDLIILGDHKILCADTTDPDAVKALFGDDRASMLYSDPPFNIGLDYDKGVGNKSNYGGSVDDSKTSDEYKEFIRKALVNALSVSKKDVHCFFWCDEAWIWVFQTLYNELGVKNRRINIWLKNNSSPTPTVAFGKAIEVCVYGTIGSPYLSKTANGVNEIMNSDMGTGNQLLEDLSNVWAAKRLSSKQYEHPTSKPPQLHEKAIRRCSKVGDIIFDSYSGSASTMICAEQLKRRVYSLEVSEIFCELAVRRYEALTGKKVKIIKNFYGKKE